MFELTQIFRVVHIMLKGCANRFTEVAGILFLDLNRIAGKNIKFNKEFTLL